LRWWPYPWPNAERPRFVHSSTKRTGLQEHTGAARGRTALPRTARPTRLRDHWRIRWLDHNGERCSTVFDSYREADQQRRLKQAEAEEVRRGQRSAPPPEKTVGDALDYWLEKRAPRKRSSADDQSIIRRHLRPAFGALRLRELGIEHVDQFMAERAALNPKTVNNLLTLLIAVLNAAVDLGWLLKVPRIRKPSVRAFSADYRYQKIEEETRRTFSCAPHPTVADRSPCTS
jgi:hypothetical protein